MGYNTAKGREEYIAVATQVDFDFVFKIYKDSDVVVWLTPAGQQSNDVADLLTLGPDYSVSINGDNGGIMTLLSAGTAGDYVVIKRDLPHLRDIEYLENGDLRPAVLNADQNYQTYLISDTLALFERVVRLPENWQNIGGDLLNPITFVYLRWEAEAAALTSESYATEPEDVFVKIYISNGDGTFTITTTNEYSSLHYSKKAEIYGWRGTDAPILVGNASGTGGSNIIITVTNWNSDQLMTISVTNGSFVDNSDGTITWTLSNTSTTGIMSVQVTEPSHLISTISTHQVVVTGASADQIILYENATMTASEFPTLNQINISGNTLLATLDTTPAEATIAASAAVSQDVGEEDFIDATPTMDSTTIEYTIDSATNLLATVSGQTLTDGDILLLNDGTSTTLVAFDTTGKLSGNSTPDGANNPSTIDTTPTMTSNTTPSGVVKASSEWTTFYGAFRCFNDIDNNDSFWLTNNTTTGWIEYMFASPKSINKYTLRADWNTPTRMATSWTLEGSNTGIFGGEEVILDTVVGSSAWASWETRTFSFINSTHFSHYRLNITANDGFSGYLSISKIEFMQNASTIDLATANLTNAPTIIAKNIAGLETSLVGPSFPTSYEVRNPQSHIVDDSGAGGETNAFAGYPCEFDYFNNYHKQNITKDTTVNTLGGTFASDGVLNQAKGIASVVVTKSRVYLLGGYLASPLNTILSAPINSDGTIGLFIHDGVLSEAKSHAQAIITKSRVYMLGGFNGTAYTDTIISAPINPDGTLGVFAPDGVLAVPAGIYQVAMTKSKVYILSGRDTIAYNSRIQSAPINPDGTLGVFVLDGVLDQPRGNAQVVVTKSKVYMLGGSKDTGHTSSNVSAPINPDGTLGVFAPDGVLSEQKGDAQVITTKSRVFLLGGANAVGKVNTIISAPIDSNGFIGPFVSDGILSAALSHSQAIVTKSRIYLLGGFNSTGAVNTIISAPFADGWEITENSYSSISDNTATKITTVFDTDIRRGRDIRHRVSFDDAGDEVTRISTVVNKVT